MLDQESTQTAGRHAPVTATYDLVVIGAGIAGLHALYAAVQYLPRSAKVLLVDRKQAAGGMWNTAYDYVRLHQPHPMFTVGDMRWDWDKPQTYLARRDEVRDHLAGAVDRVAEAVGLETRFGHTVLACQEVKTERGYLAQVTFHSNDDNAQTTTVEATRAISAAGLDYREAEPLQLSSSKVVSTTPQDLRRTLATNPGAPVYVVGGGKTGMDTILEVLAEGAGRKVFLINGRGTNFLNRTKYIPTGVQRWTSGSPITRVFHDMASRFDGDNEDELIAHFRRHHATDPDSPNGVFLYGLQSEDEHAQVVAGLSETHADYLEDVVDLPDDPIMKLRSGTSQPESGSIFVNCTGSFFRDGGMAEQLPFVSAHDRIMRINTREGFHFLTSVAGFFATHLLYRDALRGRGFYMLDHEALFRKDRNAWVGASVAQAYMNQVIAVQTLPMSLLDRCGLDLDRWYPLPRRLAALLRMKVNAKRDIAHCRTSLDRIADRFGIHCAPVT